MYFGHWCIWKLACFGDPDSRDLGCSGPQGRHDGRLLLFSPNLGDFADVQRELVSLLFGLAERIQVRGSRRSAVKRMGREAVCGFTADMSNNVTPPNVEGVPTLF